MSVWVKGGLAWILVVAVGVVAVVVDVVMWNPEA